MSEEKKRRQILESLPLGSWQYYAKVGSTNDLALEWAQAGAPDLSLVLADEQSSGRGRGKRQWVTRPGSALAMSLVLRPHPDEAGHIPRFTALAALGLIRALARWGLRAELKWPNDVLLGGKKAAGVLVEADWQGKALQALVVGMGVNVMPDSVPAARYPATCVADALGSLVDRWELLGFILEEMLTLRGALPAQTFLEAWNDALAFRGEWVWFRMPGGEAQRVSLTGLDPGGGLIYERKSGEIVTVVAGEILMAYN